MNPLVSVLIPNYNHSKFLDERIQSVLNQKYQNFEVIVLDDYSTDNSKNVIEKYRSNPKISHIIYNESNSGSTFKQWNKGFKLCKGDYIWIAESDDVADSYFLSSIINAITTTENCVIAFTNSHFINSESEIINYKDHTKRLKGLSINGTDFVRKYMLGINNIYNASSAVFKKEVLNKIDSSLYTQFKASGDRLFWILVSLQGNVCYIPEKLNYFRQHDNKVTPKAISSGKASEEDYKIYSLISHRVKLNKLERMLINGCHFWFNNTLMFEKGVKKKNNLMWKSKDYNFISALLFKIMYFFNYI